MTGKSDLRSTAQRVARGTKARMLRIIGGTWRGRTWRFPEGEIRPTPDRVRETLFNWLSAHIAGARCLDLFAGSGALGLEALSRGAAQAVFVDKSAAAARELSQTLKLWGGAQPPPTQVHVADAIAYLTGKPDVFDVVFLDPPFAAGLLDQTMARLEAGAWLAPDALIYIECAARAPLPGLPTAWTHAKSGRAGEVGYHLLRRQPA